MQARILQFTNLNGHNFRLANKHSLKLCTHMNIYKKVQKMPQYSIFKIHNGGYWANQVGELFRIQSILVLVLKCSSEAIILCSSYSSYSKDLWTNTYQRSAGDILLFSLKIQRWYNFSLFYSSNSLATRHIQAYRWT